MGIAESRYCRRILESWQSRASRIFEDARYRNNDRGQRLLDVIAKDERIDELLDDPDLRIVEDVSSLLKATRNIRIAGYYLRTIGSRTFRPPRGIGLRDLINYHNASALQEDYVHRERFKRLLKHLREQHERAGNLEFASLVEMMEKRAIVPGINSLRGKHVHAGEPIQPKLFSWISLLEAGDLPQHRKSRLVKRGYREISQKLGRGWQLLADTLDKTDEVFFELVGLLASAGSREHVQQEAERLRSELRSAKARLDRFKSRNQPIDLLT